MNYTETYNREQALQSYYALHSPIYDATRWSFLFGRNSLINALPDLPPEPNILEIGCGTGKNIELLEYSFPDAHITGVDLSPAMLTKANRRADDSDRITLLQGQYGTDDLSLPSFNLIVLSYSLTMMGSNIERVLQQTTNDLSKKGYIAVVDFHATPFRCFKKWMQTNHVSLTGSLLPLLSKYFHPEHSKIQNAYFGLWSYFQFIGHR